MSADSNRGLVVSSIADPVHLPSPSTPALCCASGHPVAAVVLPPRRRQGPASLVTPRSNFRFRGLVLTGTGTLLQMDAEGWIPATVISGFNRVRMLTPDPAMVPESLRASVAVETSPDGKRLRRKEDWASWLLPPAAAKEGPARGNGTAPAPPLPKEERKKPAPPAGTKVSAAFRMRVHSRPSRSRVWTLDPVEAIFIARRICGLEWGSGCRELDEAQQ